MQCISCGSTGAFRLYNPMTVAAQLLRLWKMVKRMICVRKRLAQEKKWAMHENQEGGNMCLWQKHILSQFCFCHGYHPSPILVDQTRSTTGQRSRGHSTSIQLKEPVLLRGCRIHVASLHSASTSTPPGAFSLWKVHRTHLLKSCWTDGFKIQPWCQRVSVHLDEMLGTLKP